MLDGYKTFLGLAVVLAGWLGIANYFGGQVEFNEFLNKLVELLGILLAAYGRYKATKIYSE
jgi:hypothetical protein